MSHLPSLRARESIGRGLLSDILDDIKISPEEFLDTY